MAVLGSRHVGGWGYRDFSGFGFYIAQDDLDRARREQWKGYVYVLDPATFTKYQGLEWRSYNNVTPSQVIEVGMEDIPQPINILTRQEYMAYRSRA